MITPLMVRSMHLIYPLFVFLGLFMNDASSCFQKHHSKQSDFIDLLPKYKTSDIADILIRHKNMSIINAMAHEDAQKCHNTLMPTWQRHVMACEDAQKSNTSSSRHNVVSKPQ